MNTAFYFKSGCVFLFLTVIVIMLYVTKNPKFQKKLNHPSIKTKISINHHRNHSLCTFRPLSPEEAHEEMLLLDFITWPETPPLPSPFSLNDTSDPAHSTFIILPKREETKWQIGDQLEVLIKMRDFRGHPKKSGGDVLLARLHNPTVGAGVAGRVVDHLNGSYSATFSLLWEGNVDVEVTLVHPSEAVTVLQRLTSQQPDRVGFSSRFQSGPAMENTICNICMRPTQQTLCNFTDLRTGEPWFCYKPKKLGCDARIDHSKGGYYQKLRPMEDKLFQRHINMKVSIPASGPSSITVLANETRQPEERMSSVKFEPSGYYFQGEWRSRGSTTVQPFNTPSAISGCLKGKVVHMYGDSTIRQWFEYLIKTLPDLKEFNLHNPLQSGPRLGLDYVNNIMVTYRCHGPPIRFGVPTNELRYIANELDNMAGGSNTVVVIGVWSHFSTFPIEVYIRRLMSIRSAVQRLLARAPNTVVIIRTANLKDLTLYETLTNSDWFSLQRDKVLRALFKGMKVHLVDAWEMTLAHQLPHNLHPDPPIIKNMINVLCSYACSKRDS